MKRTIILLSLAAVMAVFAVPALAQTKECNDEFKSATYGKWYDNRNKDQAVAFQAAEEYLAVCPNDDSPYKTAIKKFYDLYKAATGELTNKKQFDEAFQKKNYADQMKYGKVILATEPDNPAVNIILGLTGLGDPSLLAASVPYAKKGIELVEVGKPFAPYETKDKALAALNYVVGKATLQNSPADALPYFIKAARYQSDLKNSRSTYLDILAAYEKGPRAKLQAEYDAKYKGQPETPESKLAAANIDQIIDREIDAYARLAALTTSPADKKAVLDELTELYKYRNKTEAGLDTMVANILSKPLPDVPTPLTSLPTPTTPTNPGSTSSTGSSTSSAAGTAKVGNTTTTTGGSTGTGNGAQAGKGNGAKPAASPTPKKPRANHRRG